MYRPSEITQTDALYEPIHINFKNRKVKRGHQEHISGSGRHDSRPKRQRTRMAERQAWKREYSE